jgi:class 3 adenylate cyclase/tetratricopeptide (TPR) repeat protein
VASSVTATFVFTDLVGSTDLMSRVGEAAADELRREHFGLLRVAIAEHGGREVKNLGDGLMVVFDGVTGALSCAVAMQQAIAGRSSDRELLAIRVGVASGEAEVDDNDYFGLPVVEAARLCAKADGGEILATELVRMLARSRSDVELVSVGALELKGLDEPVASYRVRWSPIDRTIERPPLPSRLASARSLNFVGRDAESAQLASAWKTVVGGERRLMLLAGEPGIGKTTLAAQFASDVYDQDGLVVYGRSDEDLGVPYQPWIEALGQLVAHAPESVLAAHVADRGGHLGRLVPELARRVDCEVPISTDVDAERYVLYGCVTDLLARVSAEQPVLIVLDDLHWADRATVQLLRQVASAEQPLRVGVLGTFRDSEIGTDHPVSELLAALHRTGGAERIALRGFGDDEVLALLETIAGHEMDDQGVALRDALLAETAGNPFFVAEILRHLAESGAIYQRDGRWVADADLRAVGLPVSVREVIGRRLATLGPDSERVLALASVIGRDFDIRLLATIAKIDEDTVIDLCDGAVAAAVLATTDRFDRYTFAHALIEHALYESLSPARRARAHNTIAETLETLLGDDPGERTAELAYHWAAAVQPTDTSKAVHYAQLAGDRALAQLAPDEAVRWYSQALELHDRSPHPNQHQRAELLVGLGDSQCQAGIAAHRETLLEAAHLADKTDAVDLLVRAVLSNNRGYVSNFDAVDHERIAAIDRAIARVGNTPTAARAKLLALSAAERLHLVDLPERLALAEDAVAVARRTDDPAALTFAVQRTFTSISHPSTLALRQAWVDEVLQIAEEFGDAVTQYWVHNCAWFTATYRADRPGLDMHMRLAAEIADRIPHTNIRWNLAYHQAWAAGLSGDLAEYERCAEAALTYGTENGEPDAFTVYAAQLANVRSHQGRLHELIPLMEQAVADAPDIARTYRAVIADAKTRNGDIDEARQLLNEERANGFPMPANLTWSVGIANWISAAAHLGAVEAAPQLRMLIVAYHDQIVSFEAGFEPAVCHYLGLLDHLSGRHDDAEHWFNEALQLHERIQSPLLIAHTQAALAALLADRDQHDDHTRARVMAQQALNTATAGGYGYIETDARAVLDRLS